MNNEVIKNMNSRNMALSLAACKDSDAIRFNEEKGDIRTSFFHDIDKILYTLAYSRYSKKTQVFSNILNDHLSKRMTHVQYVSKIARTIGRALNLNEDLIEAASLAHDLGHAPFGHFGESILNELSIENGVGYFNHNIQSVRLLMYIENYGAGVNLCIQTLDAIMCHNGEFVKGKYTTKKKDKIEFLNELNESYYSDQVIKNLIPMTLEGCVVRISDMIAYLGRDIEDGIRMNLIKNEEVPDIIKKTLGVNNSSIINTIVNDIIKNSINKNYIKLSDNIYESIIILKDFNYKKIYDKALNEEKKKEIRNNFKKLFKKYLNDLETNNQESIFITNYYNKMNDRYKENNSYGRIIIDYIAGMTDDYFEQQVKNNL